MIHRLVTTVAQLLIIFSCAKSMTINRPFSGTIGLYHRLHLPHLQHFLSTASVIRSFSGSAPNSISGETIIGMLRGGAASDTTSSESDVTTFPCTPAISVTENENVSSIVMQQQQEQDRKYIGGPPPGLLRRALPSFPWHRLPDWLTYARCAAIPILGILFYYPSLNPNIRAGLTAAVFAFASFTDYLDGYLARRWKITSSFGAFLDPGK